MKPEKLVNVGTYLLLCAEYLAIERDSLVSHITLEHQQCKWSLIWKGNLTLCLVQTAAFS